jgi:hypothetical protein
MAKRTSRSKRTPKRVVVELPEEEVELEEAAAEVGVQKTEEEIDVEDLLTEIPLDARVQLWRWAEDGGWGYVGQFPVQNFSLDGVAQKFGSGRYRVIVRGPRTDDTGRTRIVQLARRHFNIAGDTRKPEEKIGLNLADMLSFNLQALQTLATAPRPDPAEMIKAIVELVRPSNDPVQLALQLVQALKGGEKTSIREVLEVLQMGMELGERTASPEDGLGQFAKALAGLVEKLPAKSAEKPAAIGPAPAPAPAVPAAADRDLGKEVTEFFASVRPVLIRAAQRQADPNLYAELLLDQLPLALEPYLPLWLQAADYPANLLPYFVGVPEGYARAVLEEFRRLYVEGSTEDDTEGAVGDGDNG